MDNNNMKDTIRTRVYRGQSTWSAFINQKTGREYSRLWPKVNSKSEFSTEWCDDAMKAIHAENSRLLRETGRCSWTSGDYVSMPSKYYIL